MTTAAAPVRPPSPRAVKAAVVLLACVPCALLVADAVAGRLGANPVEAVLHRTGDWALRLLLLTLATSPLRRWLGWPWLVQARQPLGLMAFGYAMLHALTYLALDRGLVWEEVAADVVERPYVTAGFTALMLMVPLAATSTRRAMRRLGTSWQRLHRLVYAVAVLAVLHFLWSSKLVQAEPIVYAGILGVLLAARLPAVLRARSLVAQRP